MKIMEALFELGEPKFEIGRRNAVIPVCYYNLYAPAYPASMERWGGFGVRHEPKIERCFSVMVF